MTLFAHPSSLTKLYTVGWPTSSSHLSLKIIMVSSKNERWIIPFKNISRLRFMYLSSLKQPEIPHYYREFTINLIMNKKIVKLTYRDINMSLILFKDAFCISDVITSFCDVIAPMTTLNVIICLEKGPTMEAYTVTLIFLLKV